MIQAIICTQDWLRLNKKKDDKDDWVDEEDISNLAEGNFFL